jgi:glutamate N-acetyltransferase/amino-acid N-acetyltransferase
MADAACPGFVFAGVPSGIKPPGELDLALVAGEKDLVVAGVFTKNRFRAAPVELSEARAKAGTCRAIVVNAGNANALVGERGRTDAEAMAHYVGRALDCDEKRVLVASTGAVGRALPIEPIVLSTAPLAKALRKDGLDDFVRAIQTSDRTDKRSLRLLPIGKKNRPRLLGVAKGAGLLGPDLATTLAFVFTDAAVGKAFLRKALVEAVDLSFNRMSVDGESSTNDSIFVLASGAAQAKGLKSIEGGEAGEAFRAALREVLDELARGVARDARGTSHLVTFDVSGATNEDEALRIARYLACSLPVKAALFGADPTWPRFLSAMGNCGIALESSRIDIAVGEVDLVRGGAGVGPQAEEQAHEVMRRGEYVLRIRVGKGKGAARFVGCDLSIDAVRAAAGTWL